MARYCCVYKRIPRKLKKVVMMIVQWYSPQKNEMDEFGNLKKLDYTQL